MQALHSNLVVTRLNGFIQPLGLLVFQFGSSIASVPTYACYNTMDLLGKGSATVMSSTTDGLCGATAHGNVSEVEKDPGVSRGGIDVSPVTIALALGLAVIEAHYRVIKIHGIVENLGLGQGCIVPWSDEERAHDILNYLA